MNKKLIRQEAEKIKKPEVRSALFAAADGKIDKLTDFTPQTLYNIAVYIEELESELSDKKE